MGKSDDLQAYLAAKYMTGAKADAILDRAGGEDGTKRRKKKRKVDGASSSTTAVAGGGMLIADDDGMGWANSKDDDDEEGRPGESSCGPLCSAQRALARMSTGTAADPYYAT